MIIALRQISQAIENYSRYLLEEHGMSAPQIATLRALIATDSATPGRLAEDLHLSPQTMAGILNRLEKRGWIARQPHESDGRSVRIRITETGRSAIHQAPPLLRDRFRAQLARLEDWERTQLLASLQRVARMMASDAGEFDPFLFHAPPPTADERWAPSGSEAPNL